MYGWRNGMPRRLGFIGLGLMGKPMAARLLEAGYTVAVQNRSRGAVHELATRGAIACTSGREVAACSEVIITISVAERSFPLLNLLEMLCQPHAQGLLHRQG